MIFELRYKARRSKARDLSVRGSVYGHIRGECRPNAIEGFHAFCGHAAKRSYAITRGPCGIGQVRSCFRMQFAYKTSLGRWWANYPESQKLLSYKPTARNRDQRPRSKFRGLEKQTIVRPCIHSACNATERPPGSPRCSLPTVPLVNLKLCAGDELLNANFIVCSG